MRDEEEKQRRSGVPRTNSTDSASPAYRLLSPVTGRSPAYVKNAVLHQKLQSLPVSPRFPGLLPLFLQPCASPSSRSSRDRLAAMHPSLYRSWVLVQPRYEGEKENESMTPHCCRTYTAAASPASAGCELTEPPLCDGESRFRRRRFAEPAHSSISTFLRSLHTSSPSDPALDRP